MPPMLRITSRPSRQPECGLALITCVFIVTMFLVPISYMTIREHLANVRVVATAIVSENHRCINELNRIGLNMTKNITIPRRHGNLVNRLRFKVEENHIEVCVCTSTSYFAYEHENTDCRCAFQPLWSWINQSISITWENTQLFIIHRRCSISVFVWVKS